MFLLPYIGKRKGGGRLLRRHGPVKSKIKKDLGRCWATPEPWRKKKRKISPREHKKRKDGRLFIMDAGKLRSISPQTI